MIDAIELQIGPVDLALRAIARTQPGCRALIDQIYGIGPLTSVTILAELGDTRRFQNSRDAVRYGGLDVTVRRNAFGSQVDSFETDLPVAAIGDPPVHAVFIRAPLVESVGPDVEVLAELQDGRVVGVRSGRMLGTSFHPEVTGEHRFHELFLDMVRAV